MKITRIKKLNIQRITRMKITRIKRLKITRIKRMKITRIKKLKIMRIQRIKITRIKKSRTKREGGPCVSACCLLTALLQTPDCTVQCAWI